jgi:hypothetical protein
LNLPPFVTISPSKEVVGRVFHVAELYDCLKLPHNNEPMILFLDQADGTEEIPSDLVQAVILKHDLPQLSHLAIRARQTKIMFVACQSINVYNELKGQNKHGSIKKVVNKDHIQFSNETHLQKVVT